MLVKMSYNHFRNIRYKDADEIEIYHNNGTLMFTLKYSADWCYIVPSGTRSIRIQTGGNYPMLDLDDGANAMLRAKSGNDFTIFSETTKIAQFQNENSGCSLHLREMTTPTAVADFGAIYTKADNKLYFQDGAGTEYTVTMV
jgi:hypothetical protein